MDVGELGILGVVELEKAGLRELERLKCLTRFPGLE